MTPNLAASQHDLIRDMILDESLIIYFASGWWVKRSSWNVPGGSIRNMLERPDGNIPTDLNSSRHSI
jgi:hypothetical protein